MRRLALLRLLLVALVWVAASAAHADQIAAGDARLEAADDGHSLSADFVVELGPRLAEVVANGVPLYFVVEFELTRSRWWWFDEKVAFKRLQIRLSYHALSRQYRLSTGLLQQIYPSLSEALHVLQRVRGWQVLDRSVALSDAVYDASVRMRLDTTLLPRPFQLSALTSRELNLESEWKRFSFRPMALAPASAEARDAREANGK